MNIIDTALRSLAEGFFMFWETLWALVLGFGLSGAVQAFVSRTEMRRALGDHSPKVLARASFFGMASSSCSYAASALAKSLFARGADFTSSMVFMFASTNLVLELGIVLWLLVGWQFAAAEFVGGAIMITLLSLLLPALIPKTWIEEARLRLNATDRDGNELEGGLAETEIELEHEPLNRRLRTLSGWADAAGYTISDLTMLRKELLAGFLIAGIASVVVPTYIWNSLFISGHGFWSSLENSLLGPFLAIISFVCSIGNVPLAAALWKGGISFGGVVSFIFADLITLPLLQIYRKYYGGRLTLRLLAVFWAVMSTAGLATEYLFKLFRIVPTVRPSSIAETGFRWNYTSVLDIIGLAVFAAMYLLYRNRERFGGAAAYAKDPVCGMQVEKAGAPARLVHNGRHVYFCCDGCRDRFTKDASRYLRATPNATDAHSASSVTAVDPVCGMTIDGNTELRTVHGQRTFQFCNPGCRDTFAANPDHYARQAESDV